MRTLTRIVAAAMLLCVLRVSAKEACEGFKWDISREHALFVGKAERASAGQSVQGAPLLQLDRLYELALLPQDSVRFAAGPSKKMLADGASGGLIRFRVPKAGRYRVALDVPFWIDIVAADRVVPSLDFSGSPGCDKPRKLVVYELPAERELTLQFSGLTEDKLRFTLTPVVAASE